MKKILSILTIVVISVVTFSYVPSEVKASSIGNEITRNLSKSEKDDNSLRMKFKTNGTTLKIYSIKGFRTYEYMSDYYIAILKALQKSNLNKYSNIIIDSDYDRFTFDTDTIKSIPTSDKKIKALGYENDGDADYDEFIDNYLKAKAINYKDKCETDDE